MFRQLKKTLLASLIATLALGQIAPAFADSADNLPDMGTSAGSTLSIGQELQMGDYYVRQLRGSAPLINDPLLVQYINSLGMRLVSHAYSVRTPFHFYLINNDDINAFAFFGGNVVLFQFGLGTEFWSLFVVYLIIQGLDGNLLVPVLFSEAVNLHPLVIILSVVIFGGLWGFWGVFFAIPLATLVKAVVHAWPDGLVTQEEVQN